MGSKLGNFSPGTLKHRVRFTSVLMLLFELVRCFDKLGWITCIDRMRWNITGNYTACADYCIITDTHITEDCCTMSDKHMISDLNNTDLTGAFI